MTQRNRNADGVVPTSFSLDLPTYRAVKMICAETGLTMRAFVTEAVRNAVWRDACDAAEAAEAAD